MSYVLKDSSTIEFACVQKGTVEKYFTKCNGSESVLQIDDYAVIDDVYFYKELNLLKN